MKKQILFLCYFLFCLIKIFSLNESNYLIDLGINDFKKGQYAFAINNLQKYIQISQDETEKPKAYYYLSLSYYFSLNYRLALQYLKELSARFRMSSYSSQGYFWKGLIYQNLNQFKDAEESFLKYIELLPNSELIDRAFLALANSQVELGDFEKAEKNLRIIIENYSDKEKYEEASVLFSFILIKNNKNKEAKEFLMKWIGKLGKTGEEYKFKDRFWLYLAELYLDEKEYDTAEILLKKIDTFSKNSPSSDIALLRLSELESNLGNSKEAREYLIRMANEYPNSKYNIDAMLSMGMIEYKKEEYPDALVLFKEALNLIEKKNYSNNILKKEKERLKSLLVNTLYYIADTYEKQKDTDKAVVFFQKLIDEDIQLKDEALIRLIEILLDKNDLERLNKLILKYDTILIKNKELKDRYLLYRAKVESLNADYIKSLKTLELIENEKFIYNITSLKVKNLIKLNRLKEAIDLLNQIFSMIPFNQKSFILQELLNLYFTTEQYDKVIENFNSIKTYSVELNNIEKEELFLQSKYLLGLSYMQLKNNMNAIDVFNEIIKTTDIKRLKKDLILLVNKSYYYLGWLYYKESDFIKAVINFSIAKDLDIGNKFIDDSYFMVGWSYYSNKDYKSSIAAFKEIYDIYPKQELGYKAYYLIGKSYQNLQDIKKAIEIYNQIYDKLPDNDYKDESLYEIIKYQLSINNMDEANKLIDIFNMQFPDSILYKDILIHQADTYMSLQRFSEALSIYIFLLKKYKDISNPDTLYYWAGYSSYKIKDYNASLDYLTIIINNYKSSGFYLNSLYILDEIYSFKKNYKMESQIINMILESEKDKNKLEYYKKKSNELDLIDQGYDEDEAKLIIEAKNNTIESKFNLAKYYYEKKDKKKGLEMINEISKADSNVTGSLANMILGDEKLEINEYIEAIKIFLNTITNYKTTNEVKAEALYKIAFCNYKLDDIEQAKKVIERLKINFKDSVWTQKAIELEKRIQE